MSGVAVDDGVAVEHAEPSTFTTPQVSPVNRVGIPLTGGKNTCPTYSDRSSPANTRRVQMMTTRSQSWNTVWPSE